MMLRDTYGDVVPALHPFSFSVPAFPLSLLSSTEQACTRLITRLWQQHIQPKLLQTEKLVASAADSREEQGYLDHKLLNTDFTTVREAYVAEARGPAAHRVLSNFLLVSGEMR